MIRQEEIKKIALCYAHDELKDSHSAVEDVVAAAFIDGVNYADTHPHWISVEDELPKEHEWILGFSLKRSYVDTYIFNSNVIEAHGITHWMRLSPPPILYNSENTGKNLKGGEE